MNGSLFLNLSPVPDHVRGRPRASDREVYEGILWILKTGCRWRDLPDDYPAKSSCHRRFQDWSMDCSWMRLRRALLYRLRLLEELELKEGFIDGSFVKAKKGAKMSHIQEF
jgi:transposase